MILGVDHLAISTCDARQSAENLAASGYRTAFLERALINHPVKLSLLRRFSPEHAIALCKHERGIAIEWTQHQGIADDSGAYQVLVDHEMGAMNVVPWEESEDQGVAEAWRSSGLAAQTCFVDSSAFASHCWMTVPEANGNRRGIRAVAIVTSQWQASNRFWKEGLCFAEKSTGHVQGNRSWTHVSLSALFPAWSIDIVLVEGMSRSVPPMLDDRGASCLALVSTDLASDLERMARLDGEIVGTPFSLVVNGSELLVALVRGPSGEIVELIQPKGRG